MSAPEDFDWSPANTDVLWPRQESVAVYLNQADGVVIRREAEWDDDGDTFVVIARANVPAFVQAILRTVGIEPVRAIAHRSDIDRDAANTAFDTFEESERAAARAPKDPTAAERQRRSRASRKPTCDSGRDDRDSGRDARPLPSNQQQEVMLALVS